MTAPDLQQRCWNHEEREAVCRCPLCLRCFCRECVTEHETRLLCAACLQSIAHERQERRGKLRRLIPVSMALAGVVLVWFVFYGVGESLIESAAHLEQTAWPSQ
jgi:hypothetical protein